jgi:hypothetical protein
VKARSKPSGRGCPYECEAGPDDVGGGVEMPRSSAPAEDDFAPDRVIPGTRLVTAETARGRWDDAKSPRIAATPISSAAHRATGQKSGPTVAKRPGPTDPADTAARKPNSAPPTIPIPTPVTMVRTTDKRGCVVWDTARLRRSAPARKPATTGTSTPTNPNTESPAGNAPKTGIAGMGPRLVASGLTLEPVPMANPGPTSQETPHSTRLGRKAINEDG